MKERVDMAWIQKPTCTITFTFQDISGSKGAMSLDLPQGTLVTNTIVATLRAAIENITDCAILSYTLSYTSVNNEAPLAKAGSRVERKGAFKYLTNAGKTVVYNVPSVASNIVLETGMIDTANPSVIAFNTAMTALNGFCDSNGVSLASFVQAYEVFRRTSKNQSAI
jgi:hypothetical protein